MSLNRCRSPWGSPCLAACSIVSTRICSRNCGKRSNVNRLRRMTTCAAKMALYASVAVCLLGCPLRRMPASRPAAAQVRRWRIDGDDIGGVSPAGSGRKAGVWVTPRRPSWHRFARWSLPRARRYVIPDLPKAKYVWVRGYGLVDSPKVDANPASPSTDCDCHQTSRMLRSTIRPSIAR